LSSSLLLFYILLFNAFISVLSNARDYVITTKNLDDGFSECLAPGTYRVNALY